MMYVHVRMYVYVYVYVCVSNDFNNAQVGAKTSVSRGDANPKAKLMELLGKDHKGKVWAAKGAKVD